MLMEEAKVNKVLGFKEDLRIFRNGKAMQSLIHDDHVIRLDINNNNCKQNIYTTWCKCLSVVSLGQRANQN